MATMAKVSGKREASEGEEEKAEEATPPLKRSNVRSPSPCQEASGELAWETPIYLKRWTSGHSALMPGGRWDRGGTHALVQDFKRKCTEAGLPVPGFCIGPSINFVSNAWYVHLHGEDRGVGPDEVKSVAIHRISDLFPLEGVKRIAGNDVASIVELDFTKGHRVFPGDAERAAAWESKAALQHARRVLREVLEVMPRGERHRLQEALRMGLGVGE